MQSAMDIDQFHDDPKANVMERREAAYETKDARFIIHRKQFEQQFSHIYFNRLAKLRPILRERVQKLWGKEENLHIASNVLGAAEGVDSVLIGTLYKESPLRPSVLLEYSRERSIATEELSTFVSDEDTVVLEDEHGRIPLIGDIAIDGHVTGVIVAVRGRGDDKGNFVVEEVVSPSEMTKVTDEVPQFPESHSQGIVCLVSGLEIGDCADHTLPLQMLADFLVGHLGGPKEQKLASSIVRVIVAGDTIRAPKDEAEKDEPAGDDRGHSFQRTNSRNIGRDTMGAVKQTDRLLTELCVSIPVDVMPGPNDPSNFTMPQQPLHRVLFHYAGQSENLNAVTNPHDCVVGEKRIMGTSAQTTENIAKYTTMTPMQIAQKLVQWRHMSPTCPDTLASYPFHDDDPFVIDEEADMFFVGGQEDFGHSVLSTEDGSRKVHVVKVPKFSTTKSAVLVDLDTMASKEISFNLYSQ